MKDGTRRFIVFALGGACVFTLVGVLATGLVSATTLRPDRAALEQMKSDPKQALEVVSTYLGMVHEMRDTTADPLRTLIVAGHDLKEIYEKAGKPAAVVEEYRRVLKDLHDPAGRAAIRLAIIDSYKTAGDTQAATEELRALLDETRKRLDKEN